MKIFFWSFFLFFLSFKIQAESFITIGHTQYLFSHPMKYKIFLDSLNNTEVDYIFFLGDSNLGEADVFKGLNKATISKIFSVPGNGEYRSGIDAYYDMVGYTNNNFESKNFVFLLLDSNQSKNQVIELLKKWKRKYINNNKTVILLTHHRIWDDSIISESAYKHDKSYFFSDLYPFLDDFIDYIIAGNSKRQYFQDLPESLKDNKPPNLSATFWEESFNSIKTYNIGMGNGFPYASYVQFEYQNNILIPVSKTIKVSNDQLDEFGLLDIEKYSPTIRDKHGNMLFIKSKGIFEKYKELIFGIVFGILMMFFARLINFKLRR